MFGLQHLVAGFKTVPGHEWDNNRRWVNELGCCSFCQQFTRHFEYHHVVALFLSLKSI